MVKPSYKDPPKEAAYFNYKRLIILMNGLLNFKLKKPLVVEHDATVLLMN